MSGQALCRQRLACRLLYLICGKEWYHRMKLPWADIISRRLPIGELCPGVGPEPPVPPPKPPEPPIPPSPPEPPVPPPKPPEPPIPPPPPLPPWPPQPGPPHPPSPSPPNGVEPGWGAYRPDASEDDGYWQDGWFENYGGIQWLGKRGSLYCNLYVNFGGVTIPVDATIVTAWVTFYEGGPGNKTNIDAIIYGNSAANPISPQTEAQADGLAVTSASVAWSPIVGPQNTPFYTPEIKTIIQEIVNLGGGASGGKLMLIVRAQATSLENTNPHTYDSGQSHLRAELYVEWG